jgi:hypothetical protein
MAIFARGVSPLPARHRIEAAPPGRSISTWGLIGWRYGLMKRLAVNSLNLMERDRKFCIAEERLRDLA